jgi:hypothetical protein
MLLFGLYDRQAVLSHSSRVSCRDLLAGQSSRMGASDRLTHVLTADLVKVVCGQAASNGAETDRYARSRFTAPWSMVLGRCGQRGNHDL